MNYQVFGKFMENVRNRDIELVKTEAKRYNLMSEPNYHRAKFCFSHVLVIDLKKKTHTQIIMITPVYLSLATLEISKIIMYEFWYDYMKPKYGEKVKLC